MNIHVINTELKEHRSWFIGWFIIIFTFSLMMALIYPGDDGMRDMLVLLSDPLYESFLGDISSENPSYALWLSMMSSFLAIVFAIFGLLGGVRVSMKSITDKTSELVYTLPLTRASFLTSKILALTIYGVISLLAWFVPLLLPIKGNSLEFELVSKLAGWAFLYLLVMIMLGVFLGNLIGSSGKGAQNSILLVLGLYIMQIIINLQKDILSKTEFWNYTKEVVRPDGSKLTYDVPYTLFDLITDANPMNWYFPSPVLLGGEIEVKYFWINGIALLLFTYLSYVSYNKRDLIDERGLFSRKKAKKIDKQAESDDQAYVKAKRSVKKSIYVFWARPFEKKLPYTADIIYSDRRALMILTIAVIMFWPLQLMAYTGDIGAAALSSFVEGGFFAVFTYGYSMAAYPPWVWWTITQAIGLHWILLLPMTLRWIRSIPSRDGEDGMGDLIGSLPIKKRDVVLQRLFGVLLELVWVTIWILVWYFLSLAVIESRVGSVIIAADPANGVEEVIFLFNNTLDNTWVIIAIFSQIPFYMFLVTSGVLINLRLKEKGLKYSKIFIYILVLLFIAAFSSGNSALYWLTNVFGMYNPVAIILEETISIPNYGVLVLIGMTIISLLLIRSNTKYFTWLKQDKKESYDVE